MTKQFLTPEIFHVEKKSKLRNKRPKLKKKEKTIVFDLDGTLIFTEKVEKNKRKIYFRPGLHCLLNFLKKKFNLMIFTSGARNYANSVVNEIEKKKSYFNRVLVKDDTTETEKGHIKDLNKLKMDLNKILIVDDKEKSFSLQKENGIAIYPFHGEKNDKKLYVLLSLMKKILNSKNIPKDKAKYSIFLEKIKNK